MQSYNNVCVYIYIYICIIIVVFLDIYKVMQALMWMFFWYKMCETTSFSILKWLMWRLEFLLKKTCSLLSFVCFSLESYILLPLHPTMVFTLRSSLPRNNGHHVEMLPYSYPFWSHFFTMYQLVIIIKLKNLKFYWSAHLLNDDFVKQLIRGVRNSVQFWAIFNIALCGAV